MASPLVSVAWSVLGILVCGLAGGLAGWFTTQAFDLSGVLAALLAVTTAMVVAVACWVAITVLLRRTGVLR